ncbi:MAG TPA: hypothetical protein VGX23_33000 [Actinocrinis sp.]|nr:hypothetical protein [Actinocrinis sp.]
MATSSRVGAPIKLAVWLAVTASAVTVAWFGIDSVVGAQAVVAPQLLTPVDASGSEGAVVDGGASAGGSGTPTARPIATTPPPVTPSATPTAGHTTAPATTAPPTAGSGTSGTTGPSGSGQLRRFSMVGGVAVAQFDGNSVSFVSATPSSGYEMKDWIETGQEWLRVDFTDSSDAAIVYSLFITWNGFSPQWTEVGPNWSQTGT